MNLAGKRDSLIHFFNPFFRLALILKLSPNQITFIGFIVGLSSALLYSQGFLILGALAFIVHSICDLCDGFVARETRRWSIFGSVFDELSDRYINASVIAGITFYSMNFTQLAIPIGFLAIYSSLINSFSKPVTYSKIKTKSYKGRTQHPMEGIGFFGFAECALTIITFSFASLLFPGVIMVYALLIIAISSHISLLQRILFVRRMVG